MSCSHIHGTSHLDREEIMDCLFSDAVFIVFQDALPEDMYNQAAAISYDSPVTKINGTVNLLTL